MEKPNKIKIVLTGASGKPYKFEAKINGKPKATSFLQKMRQSVAHSVKSAVYFSFTISEYTDSMIKYDIISYGYVDDINCYIKRFKITAEGDKPVYMAFHKAAKINCPSIICDIIKAPGFNAVNEHSSEIHPDDAF